MKRTTLIVTVIAASLTACSKETDTAETTVTPPTQIKQEAVQAEVVQPVENLGDQSKEEQTADDYLAYMDMLASALENVTDQKSAEAAAGTIRQMTLDMSEQHKNSGTNLKDRKMAAVMMSRQQDFADIQTRITEQMARISASNPELIQTLTEEMGKMNMQ